MEVVAAAIVSAVGAVVVAVIARSQGRAPLPLDEREAEAAAWRDLAERYRREREDEIDAHAATRAERDECQEALAGAR